MSRYKNHDIPLRFCKSLNVIGMMAIFAIMFYRYYAPEIVVSGKHQDLVIVILFALTYSVFGRIYEVFLVSLNRISEMVFSQVLSSLFTYIFLYCVIWFVSEGFPPALPFLVSFVLSVFYSAIWSYAAHKWYYFTFKPVKTAIVFDVREGLEKMVEAYNLNKKFEICFVDQVADCLENLSRLDGLNSVFLSGIHSHDRNIILKYCIEKDIRVYLIPRVGDVLMSGAEKMHLFHLPMLRVGRYHPVPEYLFLKRVFDIIVSGMALILASPVMLITAIAIKAYDHGPALYRQERLTKDAKSFYILKFRSMRQDAEKDGIAKLSSGKDDDRITPIGHFIRACRIDELPQLINILKGEMSIVGPRPERPEIETEYCQAMPEFHLRLQAKAGLTGYAQVYGKYNTSPYDKLQMDLMYIANPSLLEDLKICFATVKILFMAESTEGIEAGQTTALEKK